MFKKKIQLYSIVWLVTSGFFIKLFNFRLDWVGVSNVCFLLGCIFVIVGMFQITVDLNFYDMAIVGAKNLISIIGNKNLLKSKSIEEDTELRTDRLFEFKKIHLGIGLISWTMSFMFMTFGSL